MENLKPVPFHKRLTFRILLFNAILLFSVIAPIVIIADLDYKGLSDRIGFHNSVFRHLADRLSGLDAADWPRAVDGFPGLLYRQRICVFTPAREPVYDGGVNGAAGAAYSFGLLFPDPYVDWEDPSVRFDPGIYIENLLNVDLENADPERYYRSVRTVRYADGADRIVLTGKLIRSTDGEALVLTMSHSVVDILIQGRAIKERFLIVCALVALLSLLLTVMLTRSVTGPLERLLAYSKGILSSEHADGYPPDLPKRGELGDICAALRSLIERQKRQSEKFMKFSSDIVHELKTPLSAIRSGLEMYGESTDDREREDVSNRMHGVIRHMENLMNEIEHLGKLESRKETEYSDGIGGIAADIDFEFRDARILLDIDPGAARARIPLSTEKTYQVIANLVKNAVDFSPAPSSVTLSVYGTDGFLHIRVRDGGPGIPKEAMAHIAERFYSYRPGSGEKHSGLGLAIVAAITSSCGGSLEWSNRPEGGAEFTCRIPLTCT